MDKLNIKNMDKKASIGTVITWLVAGFIILFILLVFILFTSGLVLKKNLPFIGDRDKLTLSSEESINLEAQRILFLILNFKLDGVKFSDLILSSDFDNQEAETKLKEDGEKIIKNIAGEKCYSMSLKKGAKEIGIGEFDRVVNFVPIFSGNLYLGDSKTEINLYEYEC